MKYILSTLFCFVSLLAFSQNSTYLKFENRQIELGPIKKGIAIDTVFRFTNISNESIEIDIVDACECTTLDWTTSSIPPGGKGEISVHFDSAQKEVIEEISVDITLMNTDPKTGGPVMDAVSYTYDFIKED